MECDIMKIDDKSISLPPYISTTWNNVSSLYMKGNLLVIILREGDIINIPGLPHEVIEVIFSAHAAFIEKHSTASGNTRAENELSKLSSAFSQSLGGDPNQELPFRIGFGNMEGLGAAMQHNPSQANMPNLPPEILSKIGAIAKIIVPDENVALPKPEPHCNCIHCQIAREILHSFGHPVSQISNHLPEIAQEEEIIKDEELQFQQWDITQAGEKLFTVVSRLDNKEKYSVYLGHPVGCTCGKQGCEHIVAVLKS